MANRLKRNQRHYIVTGGAGYVGSHAVLALLDRGDHVTVIDNLSQGHREALPPEVELVEADIGDRDTLNEVFASRPWDGVLHFASLSLVGESMKQPLRYFNENVGLGIGLIDACIEHGIRRFVLSSTANVFGTPQTIPIAETTATDPSSPYGESKLMLERTLHWAEKVHGLRCACLRYFNAAGADPAGRAGEDHNPETHLIPLVIDTALGRRDELTIFGDDYPTPDGTCIRDYIHVTDLADAHLRALDRLEFSSVSYNLGVGIGHSIRDVIRAVENVTGCRVPTRVAGRRPGDPPVLVASSHLIRRETNWSPRYSGMEEIVSTAFEWRINHPNGYEPMLPAFTPAGWAAMRASAARHTAATK
jgi:UDP-glucose 4-epimerase